MKTLTNLATALIFGLLLLTGCHSKNPKPEATVKKQNQVEITELKARSGKVGQPQEANKMFNTYLDIKSQIEKNPKDYQARLKMADLYIVEARATGDYAYYYPAALKMIDGVLAENPQSSDDQFRALTSKAVIQLSLHKFPEALALGEKAVKINHYNSRIFGILTDANVEMGHYKEAVTMADSMVGLRPDLRSYSRVSYLREIYGDVPGAEEAMLMAVKAGYPGYEETSWTRVTLGNLYENYGDLNKAEEQYRIALANRQGYPFASSGLASIEAKKGHPEKAEQLLKEAIDIRPEAKFYGELALVYRQMGNAEKSKQASDQAFAMVASMGIPSDVSAQPTLKDKDPYGLKQVKAQNDANAASHNHSLEMAKMYLVLNQDYASALHQAASEYERRPDNIEVNKALAHIYYKMGELNKAEEHYNKAMVTHSKDPELMLIGGLIKIKQGNADRGRQMLRKSFETNPYQVGDLASEAEMLIKAKKTIAQR